MILRLKKIFCKKINTKLCYKYHKNNLYQIPKIKNIFLSSHFNKKFSEEEILQKLISSRFVLLTGVKPKYTKIKKSNSDFDIRKKNKTGLLVKLNKDKMFNFLTYFIFFVLDFLKDIKILSYNNFDSNYNFSFGIPDNNLFEIVEYTKEIPEFGFNFTICFSILNKKCISDILKILLILKNNK